MSGVCVCVCVRTRCVQAWYDITSTRVCHVGTLVYYVPVCKHVGAVVCTYHTCTHIQVTGVTMCDHGYSVCLYVHTCWVRVVHACI